MRLCNSMLKTTSLPHHNQSVLLLLMQQVQCTSYGERESDGMNRRWDSGTIIKHVETNFSSLHTLGCVPHISPELCKDFKFFTCIESHSGLSGPGKLFQRTWSIF